MSICNVSFGRKIPVSKCLIKDIQKNRLAEATISEITCEDKSDIAEIERLDSSWKYKEAVLSNIRYEISKDSNILFKNHFYLMEDDNGEIIGISQVRGEKPRLALNYLETKNKEKYKYIGQNMLSFLSKIARANGFKRIYIPVPAEEARDFYTKKCGFRRESREDCALVLSIFGMNRLRHKVKKRVSADDNKKI